MASASGQRLSLQSLADSTVARSLTWGRIKMNSWSAGRSYERVEPYEDIYWTPALLSAKLHVAEKTVGDGSAKDALRAYRLGRLLRIPNSALQEFLERGQTTQGTGAGARITPSRSLRCGACSVMPEACPLAGGACSGGILHFVGTRRGHPEGPHRNVEDGSPAQRQPMSPGSGTPPSMPT